MTRSKQIHRGRALTVAALLAAGCGLAPLTASGQRIFSEDFERLPLGLSIDEVLPAKDVFTKTLPDGWSRDDSGVPGVGTDQDGVSEWAGWGFANRLWWTATAGDQRRSEFTKGKGTVAIADPDEWDDAGHPKFNAQEEALYFNAFMTTKPISVQGLPANSLAITFSSSWRPEARDDWGSTNNQTATLTVSYDGGTPVKIFEWSSISDDPNFKADGEFINESAVFPLSNPAGAKEMVLRWGMTQAANDWWWAIDNINIGQPPFVSDIDVTPVGFSLTLADALGVSLDAAKGVKVELDGKPAVNADVKKEGDLTTVRHSIAPEWFAPGSRHSAKLTYTTSAGKEVTDTVEFNAPDFPLFGADTTVPAASVDTTKRGFTARIVQTTESHENSRTKVERLLDNRVLDCSTGRPFANLANLAGANNGVFTVEKVINWDKEAASAGNFKSDADAPRNIPEELIPGIPGTTGSADQFAAEMIAYVELKRGAYRFGVHSDDGFAVTMGRNPNDRLATDLRVRDGGGVGEVLFDMAVEQDGIYPVRLVWWQGTGGANIEFFSVDLATGEKILVNDAGNSNAIKAFRQGPNPSHVDWVSPEPGADAMPDSAIGFQLVAGSDTIDAASIKLKYDGQPVNAEVKNNGDGTWSVTWKPAQLLAAGSTHTAELNYSAGGQTITREWSFTTANYSTIPGALATDIGSGSQPGMKWRTHQLGADRGNSVALAEDQFAGKSGDSVHDKTSQGADGFFNIDFVNFEQTGAVAGRFNADAAAPQNIADLGVPGIPGTTGNDNNIAGEALAYLEFPTAGFHRMVVNSDDGFQVSVGNKDNPTYQVLGKFDGGRGSADTTFLFNVEKAGVYLFRMLWFEGTGGANVEWFTVNAEGCRALVNGAQAGALKAFRTRASEPGLPAAGGKITSVALQGGNVMIQFTGTLKSAGKVNGPYAPVSGAAGPTYSVAPKEAEQYFIAE